MPTTTKDWSEDILRNAPDRKGQPRHSLKSTDGGKTWQLAAPLPAGFGVGRVGPNYAWDPNANIFYASTMTKPAFRLKR